MTREWRDYLDDMLVALDDLRDFTQGVNYQHFCADKKLINAVVRGLEILGEAAKRIPKTVRDAHTGIPWTKICGLRDRLVHGYFDVDLDTVWKIATCDAPGLRSPLESIRNIESEPE